MGSAQTAETYFELLKIFNDPNSKDETKAKAAQDINESFDGILASPQYNAWLDQAIPLFLQFLRQGAPQFISEYLTQQARKAVLGILHRIPGIESLKNHLQDVISVCFRLVETDNEENVIVCLRILIEMHRHFRPPYSVDVQKFLVFVREIYKDFQSQLDKIFKPKETIKVNDLSEIDLPRVLNDIYCSTVINVERKSSDGVIVAGATTYNLLPKGNKSLKVFQEIPIIVVLMFQMYKTNIQSEVMDFIPIAINTLTMEPKEQLRTSALDKDIFVDFMGAQVKTLSFLTYIIKLYPDVLVSHSEPLVSGLMILLATCPMEVAYLRRELFIAARHVMSTDIKYKFAPVVKRMFDEDILLGKGWTVNETMRPLAYSTLADLVHHIRAQLTMADLYRAIMFFSCQLHDETLPLSIQTMSAKLLFNLVDTTKAKAETEGYDAKDLFIKMLDALVYKFQTISSVYIPYFKEKFKDMSAIAEKKPNDGENLSAEELLNRTCTMEGGYSLSNLSNMGFATVGTMKDDGGIRKLVTNLSPFHNFSFSDCRSLVKTMLCAMKTICWGIASWKGTGDHTHMLIAGGPHSRQYGTLKETEMYLGLMKWGLRSISIYAINGPVVNSTGQTTIAPSRPIINQGVRTKEEKEVLEYFAGAFTLLSPYTFREVFASSVEDLVDRIHENNALQVVANSLLANSGTSAVFATILVEFLLEKLPDMGEEGEKSHLYLRLFKLVFGSVSLFPNENEQMLRPHLREIVNRSMELALNAKDPYNYFLLLRALFRSIGGGSHDLLYQEFLPLLPSLLQGLNTLQSGLHRQQMKDLFVELCLTVPVRLSSLLPYLPMLMDPLVSALNGSSTLVNQGLRTLELCLDNLQPEFLYEHIQPVRADLMQALWRTVRTANEGTAVAAFRVLGKFGGGNRKMLIEPQKLEHSNSSNSGQCVRLQFSDLKSPIALPLQKAIDIAVQSLSLTSTADAHYKRESWNLLRLFILSSFDLETSRFMGSRLIMHSELHEPSPPDSSPIQRQTDEKCRGILTNALTGLFMATTNKQLKKDVYLLLMPLLRHFAMVMTVQQVGAFVGKVCNMDPYVLFDAMANVLSSEEKIYKKPVLFGLSVLMNCVINILRSKDKACSLPMIEYLTEKMANLCYERAWYAKMGGCIAIEFFLKNMSTRWILTHHYVILKSMFFVLTDLTGEVSAGSVDLAKKNLESLVKCCVGCAVDNLSAVKKTCLNEMTLEFVKQLTSPIKNIRNECIKNIKLLAKMQEKTVSAIVEPHKHILVDMIPPKKHLIRHQSIQSQLGLLDGNAFCLSLQPKLFFLDTTTAEHRSFVSELIALGDAEDAALSKLPCYKNINNLIPVKIAVLRVLACIAGNNQNKEKIIGIFFKALTSSHPSLQEVGFESLKAYLQDATIDVDTQRTIFKPMQTYVSSINKLTQPIINQLAYMYRLFPNLFDDRTWDQLYQTFRKLLETTNALLSKSPPARLGMVEMKIAVAILELFSLLPESNTRYVEGILKICMQSGKMLQLGMGSPLRKSLTKFLLRAPEFYLDLVFASPYLQSIEWNKFFLYFIQQEETVGVRENLTGNPYRLINRLLIKKNPLISNYLNVSSVANANPALGLNPQALRGAGAFTEVEQAQIQLFIIKVMESLSNYDEDWLAGEGQSEVVAALRSLWESDAYQMCAAVSIENIYKANKDIEMPSDSVRLFVPTWEEPKIIVMLLLSYYKKNTTDLDLLFKLLLAFCDRSISQYQFLLDFLENTVTTYSVHWKRAVFFKYERIHNDPTYPEKLKSKIIQYVLIPCTTYCFEKGQGEEYIGRFSSDVDSDCNIVSVFINRVIDISMIEKYSDSMRILLCQLSCLFVDHASGHIHDDNVKGQGSKLKKLVTFAWPSLLSKSCLDSSAKYYSHLLLSHIAEKFAIHKRIVLQVFISLLKASALEAKNVVKQGLEIITPALPQRMDDGYPMLIHWTKKILVEEGHSLSQLMHILQLVVRHWKTYYHVRHMLVSHMTNSIQRLGFTQGSSYEHRKLSVEVAEVIIKWELERILNTNKLTREDEVKTPEIKRSKPSCAPPPQIEVDSIGSKKPLDQIYTDSVLTFLMRMACHANEQVSVAGSPGEILSKRCVNLIKLVIKPDVWRNYEVKLGWFERLFAALETSQVNIANTCTALELMSFFLTVLPKKTILEHMQTLQKGLFACMTCQNSKVVRGVQSFMTKLIAIFPIEAASIGCNSSGSSTKYEELEPLYTCVNRVVQDGLSIYEKGSTNPQPLFGCIMMLKAACTNSPGYIDRLIIPFMKCLQKLCKEHLAMSSSPSGGTSVSTQPSSSSASFADSSTTSELLILSLDLVKNRIGVMGLEMRKAFIGNVLVSLIEKSTDTKVLQSIIKILEEWMTAKTPVIVNQGPSLREKSILLTKMMQNVEKRFGPDSELISQFLELVLFIYKDETLRNSELNSKLEPAFMCGLRCSQASIREKFFKVFDTSMRKRLHERLMYVVCSQNWDAIGPYYWIKQCEALIFAAVADVPVELSPKESVIPGIAYGFELLDESQKEGFMQMNPSLNINIELSVQHDTYVQGLEHFVFALENLADKDATESSKEESFLEKVEEVVRDLEDAFIREGWQDPNDARANVRMLCIKDRNFCKKASAETHTLKFTKSMVELCHLDSNLAEYTWISIFPRLWSIFTEKQQIALVNEMTPFFCSGVHVQQQNCQPSVISTFVEAMSLCQPPISLRPCVMYYLGKTHNLWHRMGLLLEQLALDNSQSSNGNAKRNAVPIVDCYDFDANGTPQSSVAPTTSTSSNNGINGVSLQETYDALADLYCSLREDELWAGMWHKRSKYLETKCAIAFEQQGFYEKAQGSYELAMCRAKADYTNTTMPSYLFSEMKLWEEHWIKCAKELNQWDIVQEYSATKPGSNPAALLDSTWRTSNWAAMKDALSHVEISCPKELAWKIHLYRGYVAVSSSEDQGLVTVDRYVDTAQSLCIKEWRRLPSLVSNSHIGVLQASQMIVELSDACQLRQCLMQTRVNSIHEIKQIVKTWRNRMPCIFDDLSHWSDIFLWRQQHYQYIAQHYQEPGNESSNNQGQQMLGVHASAQGICNFGKIARKHNLTNVCLENLSKIYSIPSVPIVDCFQKIKQQVKCYIQQAQVLGKNELQEAFEIVDSTNLKFFSKEMTAEFFALKGLLLTQIGRSEEANKAFSAACQTNDAVAKPWGYWGDYLENVFTHNPDKLYLGVSALTAFMHACRHQIETKGRKYIAKILWLLMYDDDKGTLCESVNAYYTGVPPIQWLPWVPQLLTLLMRLESKVIINVLNQIGRMYPQAVYFPIRTLYLTLKMEQREKVRSEMAAVASGSQSTPMSTSSQGIIGNQDGSTSSTTQPKNSTSEGTAQTSSHHHEAQAIRATPSMWRCSRIMYMQRDLHPTILSSLEAIVDQIIWFRENWHEEVLRQIKFGLAKCYAIAFESGGSIVDSHITPQLENFVRKLVTTFGHVFLPHSTGTSIVLTPAHASATNAVAGTSSGLDAIMKRSIIPDPSFPQMSLKFSVDFDVSEGGGMKLSNLIQRLRKWIKILEGKTKLFPKSVLMEDRYKFLTNFSSQIAEIELFGEFLIPKPSHYYVKIARFQPRIEVVSKNNTCGRRIFIRGNNGKIYPYLIVNDSGMSDARREERVLQMTRMLNLFLTRQKNTAKLQLRFNVPKLVAVSPQMRVVEDNPSSLSLLDIFKQHCNMKNGDFDVAVGCYYDSISNNQAKGVQMNPQTLLDLFNEIQSKLVPKTLVKDWAQSTFSSASDYWIFRKTFTLQVCLANFVEHGFYFTRLNPEMMYLHKDSGQMNVSYFKFDMDEDTGDLESNRPVPFRLTPGVSEFITEYGVNGPLLTGIISLARCLIYPNYKLISILRAILRDEVIFWIRRKNEDRDGCPSPFKGDVTVGTEVDSKTVIDMVNKSASAIMTRLQQLSTFDGAESKVADLIQLARDPNNLCLMDPTWYPWM